MLQGAESASKRHDPYLSIYSKLVSKPCFKTISTFHIASSNALINMSIIKILYCQHAYNVIKNPNQK